MSVDRILRDSATSVCHSFLHTSVDSYNHGYIKDVASSIGVAITYSVAIPEVTTQPTP